MSLPVVRPLAPMEADTADELPRGAAWQFEPKWDGFRGIVFRDAADVGIQSKAGEPLARYFPELVEAFRALAPQRFVLDGEIVIAIDGRLSFEDLLQRIHPAASRVAKLAAATPATFVAFDLLVDARGRALLEHPLSERRRALEAFADATFAGSERLALGPVTPSRHVAGRWLDRAGGSVDGVVAKRLDAPYRSGERDGMVKVKPARSADVVVGGFRYAEKERVVGSLLLGLYGADGLLHHVGFCSAIAREERRALTPKLEKLVQAPGFTGRAPGGPSRWSTRRSSEWQPLRPKLVVEVGYDHWSGGRFRHGTRLLRWRPDKAPRQCGLDQVEHATLPLGRLLRAG